MAAHRMGRPRGSTTIPRRVFVARYTTLYRTLRAQTGLAPSLGDLAEGLGVCGYTVRKYLKAHPRLLRAMPYWRKHRH
jgi:hypothetical protein